MLVFRGMPKRLILSRSTFSILRRGSSSCHVPERRLVIRFRCLVEEGTGTARSDNMFNRFALTVSLVIGFVVYVLTYCTRSWLLSAFSSYVFFAWVGFVNRLRKASALFEQLLAPGTSTSSTATPCAGTNQDDAHLHDNLDNCYLGKPWLHVKF